MSGERSITRLRAIFFTKDYRATGTILDDNHISFDNAVKGKM